MNTKGLPEKVVRAAGLEPALTYVNKIFLPTTAFTATKMCLWSGLSLDHIILDLGPVRQVSTPSQLSRLGSVLPPPKVLRFHRV